MGLMVKARLGFLVFVVLIFTQLSKLSVVDDEEYLLGSVKSSSDHASNLTTAHPEYNNSTSTFRTEGTRREVVVEKSPGAAKDNDTPVNAEQNSHKVDETEAPSRQDDPEAPAATIPDIINKAPVIKTGEGGNNEDEKEAPGSKVVENSNSTTKTNTIRKFFDPSGLAAMDQAMVASINNQANTHETQTETGLKGINKVLFQVGGFGCSPEYVEKMTAWHAKERRRFLISVDFHCRKLFDYGYAGSGNYLLMIYNLRLTAQALGFVDVNLRCTQGLKGEHVQLKNSNKIIYPWVLGWFPYSQMASEARAVPVAAAAEDNTSAIAATTAAINRQICLNHDPKSSEATPLLNYMIPEMQYDLRRLAIAHLGVTTAASAAWVQRVLNNASHVLRKSGRVMQMEIPAIPFYPEIQVDDAVIHFRCGDILRKGHAKYGYLKYHAYAKRISKDARRISILTQPFEIGGSSQVRTQDAKGTTARCKTLVLPFVEYLQQHFPQAVVSIHNSPQETVSLSYARMIMANQTFSTMSTFGVFGALATFGTGYVYKPQLDAPHINRFLLTPPLDTLHANLRYMDDDPQLDSRSMSMLWKVAAGQRGRGNGRVATNAIVGWFRNDTLHYNPVLTYSEVQLILKGRAHEMVPRTVPQNASAK